VDTATWLDQHHADLSPLQRALALDAAGDARADAVDQRAEATRQAAAEDKAELMRLAFRQGGVSAESLQRFRVMAESADDECRDLAARLADATARRARAHKGIESIQRQLDEINEAVASRSAPSLDGIEGAAVRAQEVLREAAAERVDAMLARSAAVRSVSLPKECSGPGCEVCSAGRELDRQRRDRPTSTLTAYTEISR
jgi:chromosome segregation ATPase